MAQTIADEKWRVRECVQLLERGDAPRASVPYELSAEIEGAAIRSTTAVTSTAVVFAAFQN